MQAINRWRNWKPADEKFDDCLRPELTKPTKPTSVSFVSTTPGQTQNFSDYADLQSEPSPRPETLAQVELLPAEVRQWDDAFHAWTQARCAFRERSWGNVSSLYVSHIEWAHQTGQPFVCDRETFQAILMALGFEIRDAMVYGLILREDFEVAEL